jgi:hypothetical protein
MVAADRSVAQDQSGAGCIQCALPIHRHAASELARAEWKNVEISVRFGRKGRKPTAQAQAAKRRVLVITDTKAAPVVEIPLTIPIVRELRKARDAARMVDPRTPWIFPSYTSESGHLVMWQRDREELGHFGNAGRHCDRYRCQRPALGHSSGAPAKAQWTCGAGLHQQGGSALHRAARRAAADQCRDNESASGGCRRCSRWQDVFRTRMIADLG